MSSKIIVAAIDFGTKYSGYAYSFKSDWACVLTNEWKCQEMSSYKVPTALLLNPDKSFNSFGYEAEETYANIATDGDDEGRSFTEYYFFHQFKKTLKTTFTKVCKYWFKNFKKNLIYWVVISLPNYDIKFLPKRVHRETTCVDKNGREAKAMLIFTLSIRYLKDHLLEFLRQRLSYSDKIADDVEFVFTVPAIWNGTAKLFMREAAIQVRQRFLHSNLLLK